MKKEQLNFADRCALLANPVWDTELIKAYLGVTYTKACEVKNYAIQYCQGMINIMPRSVKRDSVLKALGISFDAEIAKLKELKELLK